MLSQPDYVTPLRHSTQNPSPWITAWSLPSTSACLPKPSSATPTAHGRKAPSNMPTDASENGCLNPTVGRYQIKCWKISPASSIINQEKSLVGKPRPKSSTVALQSRTYHV